MTSKTLPYVLAAAARGWPVFPLQSGAKRPVPGFRDWQRHATTDPAILRAHWRAHPGHNYAVACGPSGLVVIDLDRPKGGQQPPEAWRRPGITDGADVLAALAEDDGQPLPTDTFTVQTPTGGVHLYFTAPEGARYGNTAGRLGWLIDTRAQGGYVVGPGSRTGTGTGTYRPLTPGTPVAPLPRWIAARLDPAPRPVIRASQVYTQLADSPRVAAYALAALRGEIKRVLDAPEGTRNNALNLAAYTLGRRIAQGLLPKHLAEDALTHAATDAGLAPREVEATVHSGVQAGLRATQGHP